MMVVLNFMATKLNEILSFKYSSIWTLSLTLSLGLIIVIIVTCFSPQPSKLVIVHNSQPSQRVSYTGWSGDNDSPTLSPNLDPTYYQDKHPNIYDLVKTCPCFNGTFPFVPMFGFNNPHVQTLFGPTNISVGPEVVYQRQSFQLEDGGQISLDWYPSAPSPVANLPDRNPVPIVVILHGMGGGSHASYAKELAHQLLYPPNPLDEPCRSVVLNHRGCGNTALLTPRLYNAGDTSDLKQVIKYLSKLQPEAPLVGVGFSIGGNILAKYLGEVGTNTPLIGAATVSNPYNLVWCSRNMQRNWMNYYLYRPLLLSMLKNLFRSHQLLSTAVPERDWGDISEFEKDITILNPHAAPPNKFETLNQYYRASSCDRVIHGISIPCLFLHALDDPIAPVTAIPVDEIQANPHCLLAATYHGGHTGWWSNPDSYDPRNASSWATNALAQYILAVLNSRPPPGSPVSLGLSEPSL